MRTRCCNANAYVLLDYYVCEKCDKCCDMIDSQIKVREYFDDIGRTPEASQSNLES